MANSGRARRAPQIIIFDQWGKVLVTLPDYGPARCLDNICPGLGRLRDIVREIHPELPYLPIIPEGTPCRSIVFRGFGRFNGMYLLIAEGVAVHRLAEQWESGCAQVAQPEENASRMGVALRSALEAYNIERSSAPDARLLADAVARTVGITLERSDTQGKVYPGLAPDGSLLLVQLLLTFIAAKRRGVHRAVMSERSLPHHVELDFPGLRCESDDTLGIDRCRQMADTYNTLYIAHYDEARGGLHVTIDACLHNSAVFGIKSDIVMAD